MEKISLMGLVDKLESEADAYRFLEDLRWPDGDPVCPHCDNAAGNYFLTPKDGVSRKTRTGSVSQRRVWKCKKCRKQFSAITNTVMHGTKIPVRKWVFVIYEMASAKNGISSREIERKYELSPKSAWFMLHRIREAMKADALVVPFSGRVLADETYIGGKAKNKKKSERNTEPAPEQVVPGEHRGGPRAGKTIVMTLIDEASGEARSRVIPDQTGSTLRKTIAEQVDMASTTLITDDLVGYRSVAPEMADHRTVNHSEEEYVRYDVDGIVSTNRVEGFFSQLKRSIDGTHHHVSAVHLPRYLAEFDYRYTTRNQTDSERMKGLMGKVGGRRLTYRPSQS